MLQFFVFKGIHDDWGESSGIQVSTTDVFDLYVTIIRYKILTICILCYVYIYIFIIFIVV